MSGCCLCECCSPEALLDGAKCGLRGVFECNSGARQPRRPRRRLHVPRASPPRERAHSPMTPNDDNNDNAQEHKNSSSSGNVLFAVDVMGQPASAHNARLDSHRAAAAAAAAAVAHSPSSWQFDGGGGGIRPESEFHFYCWPVVVVVVVVLLLLEQTNASR